MGNKSNDTSLNQNKTRPNLTKRNKNYKTWQNLILAALIRPP